MRSWVILDVKKEVEKEGAAFALTSWYSGNCVMKDWSNDESNKSSEKNPIHAQAKWDDSCITAPYLYNRA